VNITTVCPHCQTSYQVPPSLIGTRIKCPNALCQKPFEVRDASTSGRGATDASAASPPRAGGRREGKVNIPLGPTQVAGSVGEIVPILSAQAVPPPASPVPQNEEDVGLVPIEEDEPVVEAEPESVPEARPVKGPCVVPERAAAAAWPRQAAQASPRVGAAGRAARTG